MPPMTRALKKKNPLCITYILCVCTEVVYIQCFIFLLLHTLCVCTQVVFKMLYFPFITLCVCTQVVFKMLSFPLISYTLCVYTSGIYNAFFSSH